jgi:HEAT repeat protein
MLELVALVQHYLREWDSSGWGSAFHSLVELGPRALPELEEQLAASRNGRFRAALVELARHMHSQAALSLFDSALRDPAPEVWKAALDGLVDLASPASLLLLQQAAEREPPGGTDPSDWQAWIGEALHQARSALVARGGGEPDRS